MEFSNFICFFMAFRKMSILRIGEISEIVGLDHLERSALMQNEFQLSGEKSFLFDASRLRALCR